MADFYRISIQGSECGWKGTLFYHDERVVLANLGSYCWEM